MTFPHSIEHRGHTRRGHWSKAEEALVVAALLAAAGALLLALLLPPVMLLPGLSILLLAIAFALAALSWGHEERPSEAWYVSAALAFIGFGIALLTDSENVLAFFETARRNP